MPIKIMKNPPAQPRPELAMDTESAPPHTLRALVATFKQELPAQPGPELAIDTESAPQTLGSEGHIQAGAAGIIWA